MMHISKVVSCSTLHSVHPSACSRSTSSASTGPAVLVLCCSKDKENHDGIIPSERRHHCSPCPVTTMSSSGLTSLSRLPTSSQSPYLDPFSPFSIRTSSYQYRNSMETVSSHLVRCRGQVCSHLVRCCGQVSCCVPCGI